ncbi:MAG: hypothetical protein WC096_00785 [Sphaerochaetaceae bacterium]
MKKIHLTSMIALCAIVLLASCATKPEQAGQIPTVQGTTTEEKSMPIEAPAPAAKKEATTKTVIAVSGTMPETTVGTAPTTTASSSTTAKELTLDEKIDGISVNTTASQANEIVSALLVPTNDPDGKLTQKALAKAEAVANQILSGNDDSLKADLFAYATQIAQKAIDSTYSVDTLEFYKGILANVQNTYGNAVDTSVLNAQADERIVAINSYYKNSIYTYLRAYPKGRYVKELAAMLTKYPVNKPTK